MIKLKTVVAYLFPLLIALAGFSQPNPLVCDSLHHGQCVPNIEIQEDLLAEIMLQKEVEQRQRRTQNMYTIPVVFHIIHKNGDENISDEQIYAALNQLNKDFNASNSDLVLVPSLFADFVGNATIEFKLAQQAPDGSCTNGINRYVSGYDPTYNFYWTDDGQFYLNEIKKTHYWDTDKYLNIYVVNESYNSGLAFFPYQIEAKVNADKWLDGIMIRHYNVSDIGTAKYNNLPHTLAHEVGHYFDLLHIWGNWFYPESSQLSWENDCNYQDALCPNFYCFSDDLVADTPNTEYFHEGCVYETNTCGSSDNNRMHRALTSDLADRNYLWSNENLNYTLQCSGEPATTRCKKLYSSFIQDLSIVDEQTAYILHYLSGITNKIRYRINGETWKEFSPSDNYYYTLNEIVACATYEFQISEQCDTLFSPWSASKTFYTNDNSLPEVNTIEPLDFINCAKPDSTTTANCENFTATYDIQHQSYVDAQDGSVQIFPTSGNPPYQIQWDLGDTTDTLNDLLPGSYLFTVTDSIGCELMDTVQILPVNCDSLELNLQVSHQTYFQENDGTAFAEVNGGLYPYSYLWSTGDTIATLYNLMPDVYSVSIEDARACKITDTATVEAIDCSLFEVQVDVSQLTYYGLNNGTLEVVASNGISPYSYLWSTGDTNELIENLAPGLYNIDITDAVGCKITTMAIIDSLDCNHLQLELFTENTSSENAADGMASVIVSGGNPPYQYQWSNGDTTSAIQNLSADNYSITVTDELGCAISENVLISSPFCDTFQMGIIINDESYVGSSNGSIEVIANGGVPPYQYEWSTGDTTALIENLTPADYIVQVSDQLNCPLVDTISVEGVNCGLFQIDTIIQHQNYVDAADGSAYIEVLNGLPPYIYMAIQLHL